jgi:tetratricopeptide (TPR) repeat protein
MSAPGAAANSTPKVGRNDACPCGSGRKYKHCCQAQDARANARPGAAHAAPPSAGLKQRFQALALRGKQHGEAGRWAEAVIAFRELVRLAPDLPEARSDLGIACLALGRLEEAAANLQRAIELRPSFELALIHLASALLQLGRDSEALVSYRRLSRRAGDPLERRRYLAQALAIEGKWDEAEKELRRLLAQAPTHAEARRLLAELLSERGVLDEAAQHLAQAVEYLPAAFQRLTAVKRIEEADRPLVERMCALAERPGIDASLSVPIRFGLGKAFDDLGDYAEAMRQYDAANQVRAASERLDRASLAARYDRIISGFTAEAIDRLAQSVITPHGLEGGTPLFIVGMPRSGTTLVEQILSSHPAVAAGGELPFWTDERRGWDSSRIGAVNAEMLSKAAADYYAQLRRIGPQALRVTDKRPRNFEMLGLIRVAMPAARIIHCRRRALDTALSIFFTNFGARLEYAWDRGDLVFAYRQYERLMDHWRRLLPADRFTEVQYETLVADREAETRRMVAICGLDWDEACLAPERNRRVVRTASLWQARQPVYTTSVERWRRYEPWLGELRELLPAAEAGAQRLLGTDQTE